MRLLKLIILTAFLLINCNNKIKNGFYIYTFPNGDKYEGNWVNNEMHGKGTLTFSNGTKYIGEFKNS